MLEPTRYDLEFMAEVIGVEQHCLGGLDALSMRRKPAHVR